MTEFIAIILQIAMDIGVIRIPFAGLRQRQDSETAMIHNHENFPAPSGSGKFPTISALRGLFPFPNGF
ncbi:MAG: hypothetical protein NPINA01_11790 [Nitrospinaceae bacterium]|nr:MAG: hypothetical protein NPINA01_11790 [Nitrospinaceae bacterium]